MLLPRTAPNFLIIGAPKCGTSSIYEWLRETGGIFLPDNKEPSFFLDHYGYTNWDGYMSIFAPASDFPLRGEASAGYLAAPEAPARIHETLPNAKLIILLRNPVSRAFSGWLWMVMEGYEPLGSFADAIAAEAQRASDPNFKFKAPEYFMDYPYFTVGLYAEQIERYFALFPKEQIKIFLFDDLVNEPKRIYEETCAFLEVKPSTHVNLTARNVSSLPRSAMLQYFLRRVNQSTMFVEPDWLPHAMNRGTAFKIRPRWIADRADDLSRRLMDWNLAQGSKPARDDKVDKQLREKYRVPNEKLAALIGRDLSHWA